MNYTASFLAFTQNKFSDEFDNPILTIKYTKQMFPYHFSSPKIQYNSLNTNPEKEPIYRYITKLKDLESAGFIICQVAIPKEMAWITKAQKSMFILKKQGSILGPTEKKLATMPAHQDYAKVQIDDANLRIRLLCRKAGRNGEGPWMPLRE